MGEEYLEVFSERFDEIVEDIKVRNLSKNNMPKIIVGTGLSIIYGVPGMEKLAERLDAEINAGSKVRIKNMWNKRFTLIKKNGLEAGLADLTLKEHALVEVIKPITAKFILEKEEELHESISEKNTGFSKLLNYLCGTVSENKSIIDIMTPNYDRIIEIICDKLGIGVITGFTGSLYGQFNKTLLNSTERFYNCKEQKWVRLFKPHGSLNWVEKDGHVYLTNNYRVLKKNIEKIEIVTPGTTKYKAVLTKNMFICMREEFNRLLSSDANYSLLIYGYGFNDDHFDTALFESFQKNVLIISRDVKAEIVDRAMKAKNITIFYHEDEKDFMIYKTKKYQIDLPLWDIDQFAEVFIG